MARTGRPPKPIEAHQRDGTKSEAGVRRAPGTRKRVGTGPQVPVLPGGRKRPAATASAPAAVREVFEAIVEAGEAIFDAADAPIIEAAAVALVRARAAAELVERDGLLVPNRFRQLVANPAVGIERDAWAQFRQLADSLGIGPSARARLAALSVQGRSAEDEIPGLADVVELTRAS